MEHSVSHAPQPIKMAAAQSTLTLGPNLGTNTVSVSAAGIEQTVTFNAVVEAAVDLPDTNLRAAIETVLGKAEGDSITPSEIATLTRLEAPEAGVRNLTGLEHAVPTSDTGLTLTHLVCGQQRYFGYLGFGGLNQSDSTVLTSQTRYQISHLWQVNESDS